MSRIIQLTDLHLFRDPEERLKEVPTWETFREVCRHVRDHAGEWDWLVLTGDLAQDELPETYERLREELGDWASRCRLVPGNHDNRRVLREVFSDIVPDREAFLSFALPVGDWRVIGLDTHWPGEISGRIVPEQLDWLAEQLSQYSQQPTLVFMHHPPISVNSAWLDDIALENPQPLRDLIRSHSQVQAVATGHVHHVFQGKLGNADVHTTPSTGVQFEPRGEESSYTNDPPGYRIFDLKETGYHTQVVRLPNLRYPPLPK